MIKLSDFLTPLENFQYSVNLEFDLNDYKKLSSFIPTGSALEIIEEILESTIPNSRDRARILTGAYGKGKSHLTLAILGILRGINKKYFSRIIDKALEIDNRIADNIDMFFQRDIKLLPVLLNSQSVELKSNILQGLSKALKREALDDLMPTTFFDAAINKIISWQVDYPKTYKEFGKKVDSVEATIERLKKYDSVEYNYFTKIYPSLTSGSEFNPLQGADVISILDSVVEAIKLKGFSGIFIVYDEFSKFLDGNIEAGSAQNIKLLQDLAERCNRSGENQIHLLLISHKNIENYVGNLPKKVIDDWRGISKRFKPLSIESSDAEIFDMIASVLKKDEAKFTSFINEVPKDSYSSNKEKFKQLKTLIESTDLKYANKRSAFSDVIKHTGMNFVEKCYPLHPYTLLLLPKVSELVAQNERTIFTFLASEERYGVKHYMRTAKDVEFPLIEVDQIYDYFEPQFKEVPYGGEIRHQWQITSAALTKLSQEGNKLSEKIVKSISLLYIINQFDILPPSLELIYEIYSTHSLQEVNAAIEVIRHSGLLIELEFKPYVRIRDISGNNAEELIKVEIEKCSKTINIREALLKSLPSRYLYPVAYNDKYEMTRYFEILFSDKKVLKNIKNINEYIADERNADGYVFAIIINDDYEREECLAEIKRLKGKRVIYALPKSPIDISQSVIKYTAIQKVLQVEKNLNTSTIDELEFILCDLRDLIDNYIDVHFFSPEHEKTEYYYDNNKVNINRRVGLSSLLSEICEKVYNKTPVIINENINREILSSPMKATRMRILQNILQPKIPPMFGLQGSQDINVVRSVYVVPNIVVNIEDPKFNTTTSLDDNFRSMFNKINKFIDSAMVEDISFEVLYKLLKDPDEGIALRSGVIPFYFVAALHPYKTHAVIKRKNKEIPLSADILEQINEIPHDFTLRIESWDEQKTAYVAGIEKAINNYVNIVDREFSSFNYIVKALQKWYLHLSRFDRETKQICDGNEYRPLNKVESNLKKQLSSPEINAHEFLFVRLPNIVGSADYTIIVRKFQDAVLNIENNTQNVINKTIKETREIFGGNKKASLSSILMDYYEALNARTKQHVFSGLAAGLLDVIRQRYMDDNKIIYALIKALFGLRLDDFNDSYTDRIISTIIEAKDFVDRFNNATHEAIYNSNDGYKIIFINSNGNEEAKHISASELPTQARSFANEIETLFDEYGESLSTPQKAQVFLEVLKKIFK